MEQNNQLREKDISRHQTIEEQVWIDSNVSKIDEILRINYEKTVDEFAEIVLVAVAELFESLRGAFYIVDNNEKKIRAIAGFACKLDTMNRTEFNFGEDLIGYAVKSKKFRYIDNLPQNNAIVSSGLANVSTTSLLISPLEFNNVIYGVIELNNLGKLEPKQLELAKRLSRNIASTFQSIINNEETNLLLKELKEKTHELEAQEEELRQNLDQLKSIQEELNKEKILMDALMNNIPDDIFFKDSNGRYLLVGKQMASQFDGATSNEICGMTDYDLYPREYADMTYAEEQIILKTGKPLIDKVFETTMKNGDIKWYSLTKMQLKDEEGNAIGTFGLSKDITELKEKEHQANEMAARVEEQREELEQNLEELKSTQEDLKTKQEKLMWESTMFNALMGYLNARVTFKDKDSKFKRVNKVKAERSGFKHPDDMIGKSDFDFFDAKHAEKAKMDEQEIMNTRKAIIGVEEKLTYTNGQISWGLTSRVPLVNNDEVIGTFIITEDITKQKIAECQVNNQKKVIQGLVNNLPAINYRIDNKGFVTSISGRGLDIMGKKEKDIVGKKAVDIFPPLKSLNQKKNKSDDFQSEGKTNNKKWIFQHYIIQDDTTNGGVIGYAFQLV
jgi:PAS domain S-box-containing protein